MQTHQRIIVRRQIAGRRAKPYAGFLHIGAHIIPCALGRAGVRVRKREGDGATPCGVALKILQVYYRADRIARPRTPLPVRVLRAQDGWCDAATDRNYNKFVSLPYRASSEALWRDDHVYDIILDLSWNRYPVQKGKGSAIFMHLSEVDRQGTAGCIALSYDHLRKLMPRLSRKTNIIVL
jgi:L,D-peptidoglycan transpeptidase YkuD (ErfK/YbiS/YcfS/YnhG family)